VLLPRVTTLARLVAHVRDEANQRLWDTLWGLLTVEQRALSTQPHSCRGCWYDSPQIRRLRNGLRRFLALEHART
jgi:hypothetical protein